MSNAPRASQRIRMEIAQLAAKLVASEGVTDFLAAKRKAAERLGIRPDRGMPTNAEIEQALREYQRLFQSRTQPAHLQSLRRTALQAMQFLARFRPRLAGAVLNGTATEYSEITLHLYCNVVEDVVLHLQDAGIAVAHSVRMIKTGAADAVEFPELKFSADGTPIALVLFTEALEAVTPLSTVDGRPMRRANLDAVRALLESGPDTASPQNA
jgi:hypothetical protein